MLNRASRIFLILLTTFSASAVAIAKQPYSVVRSRDYLMVFHKGTPALGYRILPKSREGTHTRNNYVDLFDFQGNEITEDFPADHLHHRGVFWAWHQVLVNGKQLGDSWECRDFIWDSKLVETRHVKMGVRLSTETHWSSPDLVDQQGEQIPVVDEKTVITLHRTRGPIRVIDFHIQIQPLVENFELGGSDNDKGYGGFSPRIVLPADVTFWSQQGVVQPQRTAIDAGPWINIEGTFHPDDQAPSAIAIICHPENPVYPDQWILRAKGSMQNAAYPGQHPVPISIDQPLNLRYRMVIQADGHQPKRIEKLSKQF